MGEVATRSNTLIIVYVHGWQHNAREDDSNVKNFRQLLRNLANSGVVGGRRLLGVYIGWPGRSAPPILSLVTYWPRKSVAEEVGKGGVAEILLRLEYAANVRSSDPNGNLALFVGHSFGGAIMMAALHEVLLDRIVSAKPATDCYAGATPMSCDKSCVRTEPFGHGVVLLNPAIEANQVLQLKELVTEHCYPASQPKLLHVISTSSDYTTHKLFSLGQRLRMFGWAEEGELSRQFDGESMSFSEHELDRTTIGNFDKFWTGRLYRDDGNTWRYCSYAVDGIPQCVDESVTAPAVRVPARFHEPLSFVYTGADFMTGHNDVFNSHITAYMGAITIDSMQKRLPPGIELGGAPGDPCRAKFDFAHCFESLDQILGMQFEAAQERRAPGN